MVSADPALVKFHFALTSILLLPWRQRLHLLNLRNRLIGLTSWNCTTSIEQHWSYTKLGACCNGLNHTHPRSAAVSRRAPRECQPAVRSGRRSRYTPLHFNLQLLTAIVSSVPSARLISEVQIVNIAMISNVGSQSHTRILPARNFCFILPPICIFHIGRKLTCINYYAR